MRITKSERQTGIGKDQLDVEYIDDNGNKRGLGFPDAEQALEIESNGKPKFINKVIEETQKEVKQNPEKKKRLKEYEGVEL